MSLDGTISSGSPAHEPSSRPTTAAGPHDGGRRAVGALALLGYALLADIAIETFWSRAPVRWLVAGGIIAYGTLCILLRKRTGWEARAIGSVFMLLILLTVTAWQPEGLTRGLVAFGAPTPVLLSTVSIAGIAIVLVTLGTTTWIPRAAKWIAWVIGAYAIAELLDGLVAGTAYAELIHGAGLFDRLPYWLQGAFLGAVVLVAVWLPVQLVQCARGAIAVRGKVVRVWGVQTAVLSSVLAIAFAGLRAPAGVAPKVGGEGVRPAKPIGSMEQIAPGNGPWHGQLGRGIVHAEVSALAARIGGDPASLVRFVADSIRFEPYHGALRGARGALLAGGANAIDQALLLHDLIRLTSPDAKLRFAFAELSDGIAQRILVGATSRGATVPASPSTGMADFGATAGTAALDGETRGLVDRLNALRRATADTVLQDARDLSTVLRNAGFELGSTGGQTLEVIDAVKHHVWLQLQTDGGWRDLDPTLADVALGRQHAIPAEVASELPETMYHHVEINIMVEEKLGDKLAIRYLLRTHWRSADLVGSTITYGHAETLGLDSILPRGSIESDSLQRYTPVLVVDDEYGLGEPIVLPAAATAIRTIAGGVGALGGRLGDMLAGGDSMADGMDATGMWLQFVLSAPGRDADTVARALFDRIGYVARVSGNAATASLTPLHTAYGMHLEMLGVWSVVAWTGEAASPASAFGDSAWDDADPPSRTVFEQFGSIHHSYYGIRRVLYADIAGYLDIPRPAETNISLFKWFIAPLGSGDPLMTLDLVRASVQVPAASPANDPPGVLWALSSLHAERLLFSAARSALPDTADVAGLLPDVASVFHAARSFGVSLMVLRPADQVRVEGIPTSAEARARIRERLAAGQSLVVPERAVLVGKALASGWFVLDAVSGFVIDETENGGHAVGQEKGMVESKTQTTTQAAAGGRTRFRRSVHRLICASVIGWGLWAGGTQGKTAPVLEAAKGVAEACNPRGNPKRRWPDGPSNRRLPSTPPDAPKLGMASVPMQPSRASADAVGRGGWPTGTLQGHWPPKLTRFR